MSAPAFAVVPEHVARNPVARAIAVAKMRAATDEFATRVYMLGEGEECASDLDASASVMGVALAVLEAKGETDNVIRGGLSALTEMARVGCLWQTRNAAAVDMALSRAMSVYGTASATETRAAWLRVLR